MPASWPAPVRVRFSIWARPARLKPMPSASISSVPPFASSMIWVLALAMT